MCYCFSVAESKWKSSISVARTYRQSWLKQSSIASMPFEGQCKFSSSCKPSSRRIRTVTQQNQTRGLKVEDLGVLLPSSDRNEALGLTLPERSRGRSASQNTRAGWDWGLDLPRLQLLCEPMLIVFPAKQMSLSPQDNVLRWCNLRGRVFGVVPLEFSRGGVWGLFF